jgi:hypothetical protein
LISFEKEKYSFYFKFKRGGPNMFENKWFKKVSNPFIEPFFDIFFSLIPKNKNIYS